MVRRLTVEVGGGSLEAEDNHLVVDNHLAEDNHLAVDNHHAVGNHLAVEEHPEGGTCPDLRTVNEE